MDQLYLFCEKENEKEVKEQSEFHRTREKRFSINPPGKKKKAAGVCEGALESHTEN